MPDVSTNGNYGSYLAQSLTPPIFGAVGMQGGLESQIGYFGPGHFGQSNVGNWVAGQHGFGTQAQQPAFNQQLASQQQIAIQQQIAAQIATQQQQAAAQQQQIAAQQQLSAQTLQQLANQAATQGIAGQQTAVALQQVAQCVAAQGIVSQQVAALLAQIAQQSMVQAQAGNVSLLGWQPTQGQLGINPQAALAMAQLASQAGVQGSAGRYGQQPFFSAYPASGYGNPQAQGWGFNRLLF